jgi:hypothetical protein
MKMNKCKERKMEEGRKEEREGGRKEERKEKNVRIYVILVPGIILVGI